MHIHIACEKPGEDRPRSIQIYADAVTGHLRAAGVRFSEGAYDDPDIPPETDLVWAPGLGNRRVPFALFRTDRPTVATVHGLQELMSSPLAMIRAYGLRWGLGNHRWHWRIRGDWRRLAGTVSAVITVSDSLKTQITPRIYVPQAKIHTIHHGVSESFFTAPPAAAEGGYLLHVSQYSPSKNLSRLLDAYARVRDATGLPLRVVCAGLPAHLARPRPGCEIVTALQPHAAVLALMQGAHAFLFPSSEEPFGFPVIEAMALGLPVLTSRGTGAGEVAGSAAVLVDPASTASIAEGIRRIAGDRDLRARLRTEGAARARSFSWEKSGAAHLALFRQLAAGRG